MKFTVRKYNNKKYRYKQNYLIDDKNEIIFATKDKISTVNCKLYFVFKYNILQRYDIKKKKEAGVHL